MKDLTVLAIGQHKMNHKVVGYKVLSSDEVTQYDVLIYDGKLAHCTCPSRVKYCYHGTECEKIQAERFNTWQSEQRAKLVEVLDSCENMTVAVPLVA